VTEDDVGEAQMWEKTATAAQNPVAVIALRSASFEHEAEGVEERHCACLLLEKGGGEMGAATRATPF
jgi:hypothetical protein